MLPIELIRFNAKPTPNNTVILNWQTASEINNDYFTIERSRTGFDWQEIARVKGAENSSALLNYTETDPNPYTGISYYRLKQTDFNGNYSYSEINNVKLFEPTHSQVQIYPNPTEKRIRITGDESVLKVVKIYNSYGQAIFTTTTQFVNEGLIEIDLSHLKNGLYLIKTKTSVNKVYKQ